MTSSTAETTTTTPSDLEIVLSRVVDAPRARVWDACTRPEHVPHWFGPRGWTLPVCEIDLRPGGARRLVSRRRDGTELGINGLYREIVPPERLTYTEWYDHDPEDLGELLVTFIFSDGDGRTTITARNLYRAKEARDLELARVPQGFSESFDRLAQYLHTHDV